MAKVKKQQKNAPASYNDGDLPRKAMQCLAKGDFFQANAWANQILAKKPADQTGLMISGLSLVQLGEKELGSKRIGEVYRNVPENMQVAYNYALALQETGYVEEAIAIYQKILTRQPDNARVLHNLALLCMGKHEFQRALQLLHKAIVVKPDYVACYALICSVLSTTSNFTRVFDYAAKGLSIDPGNKHILQEIFRASYALGEFAKARTSLEKIKTKIPSEELARNLDLAMVGMGLNDHSLQLQSLRKAKNILDGSEDIAERSFYYLQLHDMMLQCCADLCLWNADFDDSKKIIIDEIKRLCDGHSTEMVFVPLYCLYFLESQKENYMVSANYIRTITAHVASVKKMENMEGQFCSLASSSPQNAGKITIGYLSNYFYDHPIMQLMRGVFRAHDRERFSIHYFACNTNRDSMTHELATFCDRLHTLPARTCSDYEAARHIHSQSVDILVDLDGHTVGSRMQLLAYRPAPIQVTYLGFPSTTGADFVDYIIADRTIIPQNEEKNFSETVLRMPDCFMPTDDHQLISKRVFTKKECNLPETSFVFCSFNKTKKITPILYQVWMKILLQVPGSVLWLPRFNEITKQNLQKSAQECGVAPERIIFAEFVQEKSDYLARLQQLADVALDTINYNGHTTTVDALWAGVPVITVKGTHFASRVSESILENIGMPELVTENLAAYEALAVELALHPGRYTAMKQKLAHNRLETPLFDSQRFTRNLEALYEEIWQGYSGRRCRESGNV